jgi:hypothetical protein
MDLFAAINPLLVVSGLRFSLALPIASSAAVAVCFAPEEDCAAFAVCAIESGSR